MRIMERMNVIAIQTFIGPGAGAPNRNLHQVTVRVHYNAPEVGPAPTLPKFDIEWSAAHVLVAGLVRIVRDIGAETPTVENNGDVVIDCRSEANAIRVRRAITKAGEDEGGIHLATMLRGLGVIP